MARLYVIIRVGDQPYNTCFYPDNRPRPGDRRESRASSRGAIIFRQVSPYLTFLTFSHQCLGLKDHALRWGPDDVNP